MMVLCIDFSLSSIWQLSTVFLIPYDKQSHTDKEQEDTSGTGMEICLTSAWEPHTVLFYDSFAFFKYRICLIFIRY